MHCQFFLRSVSALSLVAAAFSLPSPLARPAPADSSAILKPINIKDFENALGIQRRASDDFSDLDLQTQTQLIYGRPGIKDQFILANMTLYAPDGLQIVMMERFETLTSKVDCKGDDGEMSLTFKSKAAFKHALKTWAFINKSAEKRFLLIANHAGCGPDDERQPYIISKISDDEPTLTTFLTARPAGWDEVAGTYDLDFGKAIISKPTRRRRDILDDIVDFGGDVVDGIKDVGEDVVDGIKNGVDDLGDVIASIGDAELDKSVTFSVAVGQPNQVTNIVDLSPLRIDCLNCFITGSFQVTGHLSVKSFDIKELSIDASPQGLAATLELGVSVTVTGSPEPLQYTPTLFSAPIPGAGISLPGIFELGATISYEVGVTASFAATAGFKMGFSASLPDTAKVVANVKDPGQSTATGFDTANFDPLFDIQGLSGKATVEAFSQPKVSFGIELIKIAKFEVGLAVKLPVVTATLETAFNETGLCSQEPGASKTGVQLSSSIGVQLDLGVEGNIGPVSLPDFSTKLAGISRPLLSSCFPLDIPGLAGVEGASAAPLPKTVPSPTGTALTSPVPQLTSLPIVTPIVSATPSVPVPLNTSLLIMTPIVSGTPSVPVPLNSTLVVGSRTLPLPSGTGVAPSGTGVAPSGTVVAPSGTGVAPSGTGVAPSGTAPSYAPYPTHGNGTRGSYVRRAPLRGGAAAF